MVGKKILTTILLGSIVGVMSKDSKEPKKEVPVTDTQKALEKAKTENFEKRITKRGTLFDALESALRNNKEILSAQSELMAAHENRVTAASAFRPKASLNSKAQLSSKKDRRKAANDNDTVGLKNSYDDKVFSYGVGVSQNLFHGFSDLAALKESDLSIKSKWYAYEAKIQEVLLNVAITYFALIAKRDEISHLKALLEARQNSKEVAEWMYKTGAVKYLDVSQAIAAVSETESKLAVAAAEYIANCAQFEVLTGYKVPQILTMVEKIFDENITEKQAFEIAKKNNPQIIAATYALLAAKEAVKKPTIEFVPSLDVSYSFDQMRNRSTNTRGHASDKFHETGNTVTLSLSAPIYDGGRARAEKRKYIDMATQTAVEKEQIIENEKTKITTVWAAKAAAKQSLLSARKAVEARKIALHDAEEEYKTGIKIVNDVLEAQEKLFEAKYMETRAENDYFSNQCRANALIGRMNPQYLKLKDSGFNYKQHYNKTKNRF